MDWTAPIDAYCERTDASFWSEPVNAATNLAFIAGAILALGLWRRRGGDDFVALGLIAVVILIGIGSFLFHTVANRWTLLADVLPITVFIYAYFLVAMRRFLGLGLIAAVTLTIGFAAASWGFGAILPRGFMNGSGSYLPALFALATVAEVLRRRGHSAWKGLAAASAVFVVSLTARTADQAVCEVFPLGTHFLWHVLNGVMLFVLLATLTGTGAKRGRRLA